MTASSRYTEVIPVSQVALRIPEGGDNDRFDKIVKQILRWMAKRAGKPLPDLAWKGETFEIEEPGAQRAAAVRMNDPLYWTARLDDADKNTPGRSWITEVTVGRSKGGDVLFGSRLICASRGEREPFTRSIPGFVRQVISKGGVYLDNRLLTEEPWVVGDEDGVKKLVQLLKLSSRLADVIVVSLPEKSENISDAAISVEKLIKSVLGGVHIAVITGPAAYHLTHSVGKEFSVFQKSVRVYRPGFDPENDEIYIHPLGLWHRIETWDERGPSAYREFLVNRTLERGLIRRDRRDREDYLPSFFEIRKMADEDRLKADERRLKADEHRLKDTRSSSISLSLYKRLAEARGKIIEKLKKDRIKENKDRDDLYESWLESEEQQKTQAKEENADLKQQVRSLKARVDYQQSALRSGTYREDNLPENFDQFGEWCERYLAGSVVVLNRVYAESRAAYTRTRRSFTTHSCFFAITIYRFACREERISRKVMKRHAPN